MTFDFDFDPLYRAVALIFGVTPGRAGVDVEGGRLVARFGPWRLSTDVANVAGTEVTGPYRTLTTIGPAHLSLADRASPSPATAAAGCASASSSRYRAWSPPAACGIRG